MELSDLVVLDLDNDALYLPRDPLPQIPMDDIQFEELKRFHIRLLYHDFDFSCTCITMSADITSPVSTSLYHIGSLDHILAFYS